METKKKDLNNRLKQLRLENQQVQTLRETMDMYYYRLIAMPGQPMLSREQFVELYKKWEKERAIINLNNAQHEK